MTKSLPIDTVPVRRYMNKVLWSEPGECCEWQGYRMATGHGHYSWTLNKQKGQNYAHRIAYFLFRGSIPKDLTVHHLCFNPPCCNPWHLTLIPREENISIGCLTSVELAARESRRSSYLQDRTDRIDMGVPHRGQLDKTCCKRGHDFTEENTMIVCRSDGREERVCKTCKQMLRKLRRLGWE